MTSPTELASRHSETELRAMYDRAVWRSTTITLTPQRRRGERQAADHIYAAIRRLRADAGDDWNRAQRESEMRRGS